MHHTPTDDGRDTHGSPAVRRRTPAAPEATGYTIDRELRGHAGSDCSTDDCTQCHQGCTDSPATG